MKNKKVESIGIFSYMKDYKDALLADEDDLDAVADDDLDDDDVEKDGGELDDEDDDDIDNDDE